MALESWVNKKFGFISPVRPSMREIEVEIDVNDMDDIVDAYVVEADRKYSTTKTVQALDPDKLKAYFSTLLVLRIDYTIRGRKFREYDYRRYAVPSFFAAYLLGIGIVEDHEFGLTLKPTYNTTTTMLTPDDMIKVSNIIRALRDAFRPVDFPTVKDGNLEFMSKFTLGTAVKSYRARDHVVSAFMASVISKTIRDEVVLALATVFYGDAVVFRREIPIEEPTHEKPDMEARKPADEVVPQPLGV